MLYQIMDGTVSAGGRVILSHIDFEVKGREKIGLVGENGAGKTTLLKVLAGEWELDPDDKRQGPGISSSRSVTVGLLRQEAVSLEERGRTVEEYLLKGCAQKDLFSGERFAYETEFDKLFTGFGFGKSEKTRPIAAFSGGEQTKIALIRLLLAKPDILLLDEPTNHLDMPAVEWLEGYLKDYGKAAVFVSHDRFFLDQTADVICELSGGKIWRYPGNYTHYREEKRKRLALQEKAYARQQQELKRLDDLVERFKHKPNKAAFARSRRSIANRISLVEKPGGKEARLFTGEITPAVLGAKWVVEAKELKVGYDKPLFQLSLRVRRGLKIGIIGDNGTGKTAFLQTVAGHLDPLGGKCILGNRTVMGYFGQHSAEISSDLSVAEHFHRLYPSMTEKEARSVLGAYLFGGKRAGVKVDRLSGGEKARLVLAEILQGRPNLLLLDEPTNHMDIQAKEVLESAFRAYRGTILFVSHDRYFIRQVADALLIIEEDGVMYYPFGYEHYLSRSRMGKGESLSAQVRAEDQALISGLRAVPKAERHNLREPGTEEAYLDWKLGLAEKQLLKAEQAVEELWEGERGREERQRERAYLAWLEGGSVNFCSDEPGEKEGLLAAWEEWTKCCLEWYDIWAGDLR